MENEKTDINEARIYKPWLRFQIGDSVFLKSDLKRKCCITISLILPFDDEVDYRGEWMNSQKVREVACFNDKVLTV